MGVDVVPASQRHQSWGVLEMLAALSSSSWCTALSWWMYAVTGPSKSRISSASAAAARKAAAAEAEAKAEAEFEAKRPVDLETPAAAPWKFSNVSIHSIEHVMPPVVVSTRETMERLGWRLRLARAEPDILEKMTGIKERRFWEKGTTGVQAATWACRKVIESSGVDPNRIGIICNTSVWRDYLEPGMAVCIQHELGLPASCINLDVTNACVGMVSGMLTVATMIEAGVVDYALVVDAECAEELYEHTMKRMCSTLNLNELRTQLATLTLGSGSVAAILCRSDLAPPGRNHRLTGAVTRCAPFARNLCRARYDRMETDTSLVLHGAQAIKYTYAVAVKELGWTPENVDVVACHQVSNKTTRLAAGYCGFDVNKMLTTFPYTGNVGPASIGIALSIAEKEGRVKEGMRVAFCSIGSGVNCIMAEVLW